MKKLISTLLTALLFFAVTVSAQKKSEEIKILTSAQCGQCKDRIEKMMAYEKGVMKSNLNLEDKVLTVTYNPGRTSPDKIRKAVNSVGYDADNSKADEKAYAALPGCCKKPDDPAHIAH